MSARIAHRDDRTVVGTLVDVEGLEHPDGWLHVLWDGDDYICVLSPGEVVR